MSKKDYYIVEKNTDKIINLKHTNFLDPSILKKVKSKLKGYNYKIYYPYKESDKVIIYTKEIPRIKLLEIISYDKLTHRKIMGSLFNLHINTEMIGDIIIYNDHYYVIILENIYDLIIKEFNMIGRSTIKLKEVPLNILDNYQRKYEITEIIVSSLRIDTIISRLIGINRETLKKKFTDGGVILNYEVCNKTNYNVKENDAFSIKKYGKYKFMGIIKNTKKDNYIIKLYKFIDN